MSRGRKPKANESNLSWQQIFNKNVGKYLQCIIIELSKIESDQSETGSDLLITINKERETLIKEKKLKKGIIQHSLKKDEIPFKIAENWAWCRLGEIGICQTGTTPSTVVKEYFGNDIPFIKPADITLNGLICNNEGLSFLGLKQGVLIPKNTLMMVCIGGSIGKSFYTDIEVSCNQQINTITPFAGISARFLQFLMQSDYFQKAIWAKASGGTTPIVNRSKWESIPVPLPPLSEQNKILAFLNDFENDNLKEDGYYFNREVEEKVIALHEAQLKGFEISAQLTYQLSLVKKFRQLLLQDAVKGELVDNSEAAGESAHELLKRIKAEKEQLIKEKKLKKEKELPSIKAEEIPFEIPEDWVWCRLGEIGRITGGGTPSMGNDDYWNGNIPWVSPKDMWTEFVSDTEMKVTPKGVAESSTNLIPVGSLLIVGRSGILKRKLPVAINKVECTVNQDMKVIIPHVVSMNRFLQLMFWGLERIILKDFVKFGMTVHSLKYEEFAQMPIPLPPLSTQRLIVEKVEGMMELCDGLEASISVGMRENEQLLQQVLREALQG